MHAQRRYPVVHDEGRRLDAFDEVQVCTHYEVDGETSEHLPYLLEEALVKPCSSPVQVGRVPAVW